MSSDSQQPQLIRLQRYLASCGLGSRRSCERFITEGRVTVDGKVVDELGAKVDPQTQQVALDGENLRMERKKYYIVNKPTGYVSTNRDPQRRPRVIDLFPAGGPRLFLVGRLDEASEGLLIVTNDGDLAQKLAHPKYRIYRTYRVQVAGEPSPESLRELKRGMHFAEGRFRVHDVKPLKKQGRSMFLEAVLAEGQNRELRRLFARIGHKVLDLKRIAFGPIKLGRLPVGQFRELRRDELAELLALVERNRPGKRTAGASKR
ncbi:MAG: rRNA pseudouridine synthase [Planctomycetota bacterium]|nr:MAG: rRNA pseudouridine synthase [Planctomycetota bacterium]REJ91824.1 MAG: rRNA pseudouridine synthase [Planctomycetota bacterium]REK23814.1 MAG: rRNA pseudouridine synthase [Planctomycetota bacterium]REK32891.1 MAG: rRNA pseudouridine synthase [Planctomycetota bacterium]